MQKAHSIFYGTLVDAKNGDRATYRDMGLQCALCGAGVFWAEGEHQAAHFRHFPDRGDPNCENRAKTMPAAEWEKKQRAIEQQHLRFLQQRFWQIFSGVYAQMRLDEVEARAKEEINQFPFNEMWNAWSEVIYAKRDAAVSLTAGMCNAMVEGNYAVALRLAPGAETHQSEADRIAQDLIRTSQRSSAIAAMQFLLQPKSRPMLEVLFFYALFDYGCYAETMPNEFPQPISEHELKLFYLWALTDIIGLLLSVPWAKAADAIRQTGQIPESLRSNIRPRIGRLYAVELMGQQALSIFGI